MSPRPMDVVRARNHSTGDYYTTTRHLADKRGDRILEGKRAVDQYGRWLPLTPHKDIEPVRDDRGRFTTPEADSLEDQPLVGEEEA